MRAQRVREGENRVEMQIVKWTAEGTGKGSASVDGVNSSTLSIL